MARNRLKTKGRTDASRSFAGIPRIVMEHHDYKSLSGSAVKLLNLMAYQYRGKNNGDLTAAWGFAKKHGFNSQATLNRATHELLNADLILRTRDGVFLNPGGRCALYAVTWQPIDECIGKISTHHQPSHPLESSALRESTSKHPIQKRYSVDTETVSTHTFSNKY